MGIRISVEVIFGNRDVQEDDLRRAENAALAVIDGSGKTVQDIYAEYKRQWCEFDDYARMTGDALTWVIAEKSANIALTRGWRNPGAAGCAISA